MQSPAAAAQFGGVFQEALQHSKGLHKTGLLPLCQSWCGDSFIRELHKCLKHEQAVIRNTVANSERALHTMLGSVADLVPYDEDMFDDDMVRLACRRTLQIVHAVSCAPLFRSAFKQE